MLLDSGQALKIVPLDWIIFSLILGYLKVKNNPNDPSSILAKDDCQDDCQDNCQDDHQDDLQDNCQDNCQDDCHDDFQDDCQDDREDLKELKSPSTN